MENLTILRKVNGSRGWLIKHKALESKIGKYISIILMKNKTLGNFKLILDDWMNWMTLDIENS